MYSAYKLNSVWKSLICVWLFETPWSIQSRILEWVAIPFSRESSQPRGWAQASYIAGRFFTKWATRETHKLNKQVTIYSLEVALPQFWTSPLFHVQFQLLFLDMYIGFSGDRCGSLVFLSQFVVIYTVKGFGIVNKAEVDAFSWTLLLSQWSNRCWQFDLWFLCLF